MTDNRRIAKNTAFLYVRMLLVMGATLYTSRVVLRVLGEVDYGLYNVVGGLVTMFTFLNGSLGAATSRYITFELGKKNSDGVNRVFNVALVIHVMLALLIIALAETVGLWFFYEKMTISDNRMDAAFWVYQISIVTCFFSLTQVPYNAIIIAHEDMRVYAWVGIAEAAFKLAVAFVIMASPFDALVYYALLLCAVQVIIMLFYRFYCNRHFKESRIRLYKDKALYKEMFSFGGADLIGYLSVLAQGQGLNLLLNMFFGPTVNAARGIAYQVQGAVTQFGNNFMTAVKPQIIKSYAEGDVEGMMRLVKDSSCFSFYLMWLICLPIFLETDYILRLWLGDYPDHSVSFLRLVLVLCLIQTLKTPRSTVFHATGHIKFVNMTVGTVLCLALPLAYLGLKMGFSPESVFVTANATMILSELVSVFVLKKYVSYSIHRYLLAVHGRCLLVACLSMLVPMLVYDKWMDATFGRLVVTCLISTASIGVVVLAVGLRSGIRDRLYCELRRRLNIAR